ncbi:aminotransferase class I/II-fold pyridoxal phosphate-dependent enzyme [Desulfoluna spongiiphila]|uniref:Aspartate/methionine/tyrosine aminotransferase n=1 Tax=Desulfoluna spongiiphila TaxID=419481 RepID=A0A1G5ALS3_9BACT|nr:aminotransferase class I/II-fold pyridoxal phosphate-dependent enzyme [Desulfoluna spongiiphila]SCX78784.1 Aspartate/methionine/tyrosine aminotransferase [Desulfoluna spongiiphila]VVS90483.1 pyridoxal phosphate-dependent transferase [Desulfoluna spongiiphila]
MNEIARQLNEEIAQGNGHLMEMLSEVGKNLFFPKGILSQSAEAKQKAHRINATIGIAKEEGGIMRLPSVMDSIEGLAPENSLTYAPSFGIPGLRSAWKEAMYEKNPSLAGAEVSLPVVACGITQAISVMADVWVDPGDVVILPNMMWGNYNLILSVRKGATLSKYNLFTEAGGFDLDAFQAKVKEEAAARDKIIVLLNFPQNPTGYTVTKAEAAKIADILEEVAKGGTNVIAVTDDAYFGLFYEEDVLKESIFSLITGRHERLMAIKMDGATKEDYVWGLRVGFLTYGIPACDNQAAVYEALEKKTAGAVRGSVSNASHLSQSIVLKAMQTEGYAASKEAKGEILKARANKVAEVSRDPKYADAWSVYPFNSGYFMCIRLANTDAETLRLHLLDTYGVGLISLGATDLRVAFSCIELDDVHELFDTIYKGVQDLAG